MRINGQAAPGRSRLMWAASFALAIVFTAFQIQSSLHSGALSLPATYDDVGYFNDALQRLEILYREGAWALLKNFVAAPPHAPTSTVLAMAGFALFGPHAWAADLMNAIPLAFILRLMLGMAYSELSLKVSLLLVAAFLGFPMFGLLVLEFRPDMLCALAAAAGALIIAGDPLWASAHRRTWRATTALFVVAMLAKPTLAPVTVFVFGVAILVTLALQSRDRGQFWFIAGVAFVSGGIGVLLVLPYYILSFARVYEYIVLNAFGAQKNVWALTLSVKDHLLYYLAGQGGVTAIGRVWLTLSALLVAGAAVVLARGRHRRNVLAVVVVALAAYTSVTAPAMKSPFIGLIVPAVVLWLAFAAAVVILSRLPHRWALVGAVTLLVVAAATWRPISHRLWTASVPAVQSQNFQRILQQTVDAVATVPDLDKRKLYFPVIAQYLNQDNVWYELRRRNLGVPAADLVYLDGNMDAQRAQIAAADLVILFSDDSVLPIPWPATTKIRKEITAAVAKSGAFQTIAEIDGGPSYPGKVIVLKRK